MHKRATKQETELRVAHAAELVAEGWYWGRRLKSAWNDSKISMHSRNCNV